MHGVVLWLFTSDAFTRMGIQGDFSASARSLGTVHGMNRIDQAFAMIILVSTAALFSLSVLVSSESPSCHCDRSYGVRSKFDGPIDNIVVLVPSRTVKQIWVTDCILPWPKLGS